MNLTLALPLLIPALCAAADISGDWIAQVSGGFGDPQYARVKLKVQGSKLAGSWNDISLEGSLAGDTVEFTPQQHGGKALGSFKGRIGAVELSGEGVMEAQRGGGGRMGRQPIVWNMTRAPNPTSGGPKTWDFEPKEFYTNYSAAIPPALRIFPGDTVRTRSYDTTGRDAENPARIGRQCGDRAVLYRRRASGRHTDRQTEQNQVEPRFGAAGESDQRPCTHSRAR